MDYGQDYVQDYGQGGYTPDYAQYYDGAPNAGQMVEPKKSPNRLWKSWGGIGILLGMTLVVFGGTMLPIEVARIISGSLNRTPAGAYALYPNYNRIRNAANAGVLKMEPDVVGIGASDLAERGIIPYEALSANGFNNYPIQDKYLWPWSHAALLFSLVTLAAGFLGIVSGCRRTYGSIFSFFSLALLSWMLSIFLIVYYAVEIFWQTTRSSATKNQFYWGGVDFRLAATMLALSCAVFIFSMLSACCAGCGFGIGSNKARLTRQPRQRKQKGVPADAY